MKRIASLALVGLLAAVGQLTVLPQAAVAADPSAAVDEIQQIRDATWAAIDAAVAEVAATLPDTATDAEARAIRDTGKGTVDDLFWSADDAMAVVVGAAGNDPAVEEAYDLAWFALKDHRLAAKSQITSLYEAWKFEYNAPPAEEVIANIDTTLVDGVASIAGIVDQLTIQFEVHVDSIPMADEEHADALGDLDELVAETIEDLDSELADRPFDATVQAAHTAAVSDLAAAAAAAVSTIDATHAAWVAEHTPPPSTTTTTAPPPTTTTTVRPATPAPTSTTTTSTVPPTTTTTTTAAPSTTTTTVAPAAPLPPSQPPMSESAYLPSLPAPVVLSAAAETSLESSGDGEMAAVWFVRRVVDSQLPAGVSTVAAGPLVVLGLIVDAIRAAGALMAVPWLLLGIYMVGLLRGKIPLESKLMPEG